MNRVRAALLVALLVAPLASCGGGGSYSPPPPPTSASPPPPPPPPSPPPPPAPPPPGNLAPVFTSPAAISAREGVLGRVYLAAATDPEGAALTYALSGADAARFVFNTTTLELSFVVPPDFDAPTDAAPVNNIYNVRFSASDGTNTTNLDVAIAVTNAANGFRVRRVFAGPGGTGNGPEAIESYPDGSGRLAMISSSSFNSRIRLFDPATGAYAAQDVVNMVPTMGPQSYPSNLAFSPNYLTDRKFYVLRRRSATGATAHLEEFSTSAGNPDVVTTNVFAGRLILDMNNNPTFSACCDGGFLEFDNSGALLVGTGDNNDPGLSTGSTAQSTTSTRGKLLRIIPQGDDFPADSTRNFTVPAGNPASPAGSLPELFAIGIENPDSGAIDPVTGEIYFVDNVGATGISDEINRGNLSGPFRNYGWNIRRGTQAAPVTGGPDSAAFTPPSTEATSLKIGAIYRGPIASLRGNLIVTLNGVVHTVPATSLPQGLTAPSAIFTDRTADFVPDVGTLGTITAMGSDAAGNFYMSNQQGDIFALEPN